MVITRLSVNVASHVVPLGLDKHPCLAVSSSQYRGGSVDRTSREAEEYYRQSRSHNSDSSAGNSNEKVGARFVWWSSCNPCVLCHCPLRLITSPKVGGLLQAPKLGQIASSCVFTPSWPVWGEKRDWRNGQSMLRPEVKVCSTYLAVRPDASCSSTQESILVQAGYARELPSPHSGNRRFYLWK